MRIFCPAMMASVPSLDVAVKRLPDAASTCTAAVVAAPRPGVSDPRGRACRARNPGSAPGNPERLRVLVHPGPSGSGGHAVVGDARLTGRHAGVADRNRPPRAEHNLFSMPYRDTATKSGLPSSLQDLGDPAGAHGPATLADGELEAVLHGDGLDQLQ